VLAALNVADEVILKLIAQHAAVDTLEDVRAQLGL
jgi:hypothetical protein